jgi:acetyl-CoA C-acetyltransferase
MRIVIVGVGRLTSREYQLPNAKTPVELVSEACRRAERDTGSDENILRDLEAIGTTPSFCERRFPKKPLYKNFPKSVANAIGAKRVKYYVHAFHGGNGPQLMVNEFAEKISNGEIDSALVTGYEILKTFDNAMRQNQSKEMMIKTWVDRTPKDRPNTTNARPRRKNLENVVNMFAKSQSPAYYYGMFENAYRARRGLSNEESNRRIGKMYSEFTHIASKSPEHSWYPTVRTSREISDVTVSNFMVCSPYSKNMCAIERVNQSAAILIMSEKEAIRRHISKDRWMYVCVVLRSFFYATTTSFVISPHTDTDTHHHIKTDTCGDVEMPKMWKS